MSDVFALTCAAIFDGEAWHDDAALVVRDGMVEADRCAHNNPGPGIEVVDDGGGILAPGFVDLQVNGGGGVMLNDHPTVEGIETICRAHAQFGTTALLPTLITDTPEVTAAAIAAGIEAARRKVPGFAGLHLEGPHLSIARKGAHDPKLIRPMTDADQVDADCGAQEAAGAADHRRAGIGDAGTRCRARRRRASSSASDIPTRPMPWRGAYADAGASMVTHLFNAMSQIGNREPGLAGAAIDLGQLSAGLIADGIHVDPATIAIALRAKNGPAHIFLVTDAMATIGTDMKSFTLNGRTHQARKRPADAGRRHARRRRSRHDLGGALHASHDRTRSWRGAAHGLALSGAKRSGRPTGSAVS